VRPRYPEIYRCLGGAAVLGGAENYSAVGLYNNSQAAHVLIVWNAYPLGPELTSGLNIVPPGQTWASAAPGIPAVGGEAVGPGQLVTASFTANPSPGQLIAVPPGGFPAWPYDYPICVLQPGYSLLVIDSTGGGADVALNVFWEYADPSQAMSWHYPSDPE
jgi:hypothetical protein